MTFQDLTNRARVIAIMQDKRVFDIIDLFYSVLFFDVKWETDKFFVKENRGVTAEHSEKLNELFQKAESIEISEQELKESIIFDDPSQQQELIRLKKKYNAGKEEEGCKRISLEIVDLAYKKNPELLNSLGYINKIQRFHIEQQNFIEDLKKKVIGQDHAVEKLVKCFSKHYQKINSKDKIKNLPASLFIIGDVGTGKTNLAKKLVETIPETWLKWKYKYINAKQLEGIYTLTLEELLFEKYFFGIEDCPQYVFIIDEIYDGDANLFRFLQQIIGEGEYHYNKKFYDFSKSFFIFITSQGNDLYNKFQSGIYKNAKIFPREIFIESLLRPFEKKFFGKAEQWKSVSIFIDRIDDFIVLENFSFFPRKKIIQNLLCEQAEFWKNIYELGLIKWSEEFLELLTYTCSHLISYRQIKRHLEQTIFKDIEEYFISILAHDNVVLDINLRLEQEGCLNDYLKQVGIRKGNEFLVIDDIKKYHKIIYNLGFDEALFSSSVVDAKNLINEKGIKNIDWILLDLVFPAGEPGGLDFLKDFRKKHKRFPIYLFSTLINNVKDFYDIVDAGGAAGFIEKSNLIDNKKKTAEQQIYFQKLRKKISSICKETAFDKICDQVDKKGEIINSVLEIKLDSKNNTLDCFITYLKRDPKLRIRDSAIEIQYPETTFKDIKGQSLIIEDVKAWIKKIKDKRITKSDMGLLLFGPSGTGKTLIAKAIANEIDAYFIPVIPGNLKNKYVGESEAAVKDLFDIARKNQPSVIFIDEIDGIGDRASLSGSNSWEASFINTFLAELDGFEENSEVFMIGATNHKERIDEALLRPGRLGKHILVSIPKSEEDRKEILLFYLNKSWLNPRIPEILNNDEINKIVKVTEGFSPAMIMQLVNIAEDIATKEKKQEINSEALNKARMEIIAGKLTNEEHSPEVLNVIACHEVGHAIVARKLGVKVHYLTVQMREKEESTLGFMEPIIKKELKDRKNLIKQIAISLAGREAEKLIHGKYFDGAGNDIRTAQFYAEIILKLGMTDSGMPEIFQPLTKNINESYIYDNSTIRKIKNIMKEGQKICIQILTENKKEVEDLIGTLIKEKSIFFNE